MADGSIKSGMGTSDNSWENPTFFTALNEVPLETCDASDNLYHLSSNEAVLDVLKAGQTSALCVKDDKAYLSASSLMMPTLIQAEIRDLDASIRNLEHAISQGKEEIVKAHAQIVSLRKTPIKNAGERADSAFFHGLALFGFGTILAEIYYGTTLLWDANIDRFYMNAKLEKTQSLLAKTNLCPQPGAPDPIQPLQDAIKENRFRFFVGRALVIGGLYALSRKALNTYEEMTRPELNTMAKEESIEAHRLLGEMTRDGTLAKLASLNDTSFGVSQLLSALTEEELSKLQTLLLYTQAGAFASTLDMNLLGTLAIFEDILNLGTSPLEAPEEEVCEPEEAVLLQLIQERTDKEIQYDALRAQVAAQSQEQETLQLRTCALEYSLQAHQETDFRTAQQCQNAFANLADTTEAPTSAIDRTFGSSDFADMWGTSEYFGPAAALVNLYLHRNLKNYLAKRIFGAQITRGEQEAIEYVQQLREENKLVQCPDVTAPRNTARVTQTEEANGQSEASTARAKLQAIRRNLEPSFSTLLVDEILDPDHGVFDEFGITGRLDHEERNNLFRQIGVIENELAVYEKNPNTDLLNTIQNGLTHLQDSLSTNTAWNFERDLKPRGGMYLQMGGLLLVAGLPVLRWGKYMITPAESFPAMSSLGTMPATEAVAANGFFTAERLAAGLAGTIGTAAALAPGEAEAAMAQSSTSGATTLPTLLEQVEQLRRVIQPPFKKTAYVIDEMCDRDLGFWDAFGVGGRLDKKEKKALYAELMRIENAISPKTTVTEKRALQKRIDAVRAQITEDLKWSFDRDLIASK